ncbi:hypothetical protein AB0D49_25300 [Streptomyces sp. NPDC048290]|uniref:hypothetical protein n=1 Tax=Streptomyces sp. NPDC048290 TaxID=3155811 RepID=UPI003426D5E5
MTGALADVQAGEHPRVFGVEHRPFTGVLSVRASSSVSYWRIHVMRICHPRPVRHRAGRDAAGPLITVPDGISRVR